ncbi:PrgI family protein [Enterococcus sp. AN402]|uniref:PrgI family protein n=1 Tax=Enterococcus sp. AN402 TaxID=3151386 RepID=UPI0034573FBF
MEIKVYKDGSKIKNKIVGLTLRQFLALLLIGVVTIFMSLNSFFFHIEAIFFELPLMISLFIGLFFFLIKINGLPSDRWFKLKWAYLNKPIKRTYQTERIVNYERKEFIQSKKVKETATFIQNREATVESIKEECTESKK